MAVHLVGGGVRDLLLDRDWGDADFALDADPAAAARDLVDRWGGGVTRHPAFRTVVVRLADGLRIDLARRRRESYPRPAALPIVRAGSLEEDLFRRDFTINAMALTVEPRGIGGLVDPFGGLDDLARRRIRALHERSFLDDPTRAFRAVRFATRLGFRIETVTREWIGVARERGVFHRLSGTRLRRAIDEQLAERRAVQGLRGLEALGLLREIDGALTLRPETVAQMKRVRSMSGKPGSALEEAPASRVVLAALLWRSLPAAARERLAARLHPPRRELQLWRAAAGKAGSVVAALSRLEKKTAGRVYRICRPHAPELLWVCRALSADRSVRRALSRYLAVWRHTRLEIDGRDLLAAGIVAGPRIAAALATALEARLEGRACSREAQLRAALAKARGSRAPRLTYPGG